MIPRSVRLFIQLSRPLFLLGAILLYALGIGIARYLGATIDWGVYVLGQAWVTTLQLSAHYLNEYFDAPADANNPNRTFFSGGSGAIGPGKLTRNTALIAGLTTLTLTASLTVTMLRAVDLAPVIVFVMLLSFLGALFYSVPPVKLAYSGYGELTTSILVANMVPIFAFLLQVGQPHRLLVMSTFPLTALHLAMMLAFEFPDYATDLKYEKQTLLVRLGWRAGMTLHNLLILASFVLLGLATLFGLPAFIALPAFLPLPLGLLQIWQMRRIAAGAKPSWNTLAFTAVVLFGSMVYLLAFDFWIR
jgi:1,4-dihydroxy-2-naphthoate octaprenyltransferase